MGGSVRLAGEGYRYLLFGLLFLALMLSLWPRLSSARPEAGRTYHLLILDSQFGNPYDEVRSALLSSLAASGYRAGENLKISLHAAGNDVAVGESLLRREMASSPDVVFVGGTVATLAAHNVLYGHRQPVIFGSPTDPVGIGVIANFHDAPRANFSGVCYPVPLKARFRFMRQLLPGKRTFGLIFADMPQSHSYNQWIRDMLKDPEFKDIEVIFRAVPLITGEHGDRKMAEQAISIIRELDQQVDAFIKPNDQLGTRRSFAEAVHAHATKPLIGIVKNDVMAGWGATAVIYPSHESIGRQSARMIQRLFEGAKIREITPQWPRKYGYAVDLPKTRRFGVTVPVGLLQLAGDNIIK